MIPHHLFAQRPQKRRSFRPRWEERDGGGGVGGNWKEDEKTPSTVAVAVAVVDIPSRETPMGSDEYLPTYLPVRSVGCLPRQGGGLRMASGIPGESRVE